MNQLKTLSVLQSIIILLFLMTYENQDITLFRMVALLIAFTSLIYVMKNE